MKSGLAGDKGAAMARCAGAVQRLARLEFPEEIVDLRRSGARWTLSARTWLLAIALGLAGWALLAAAGYDAYMLARVVA